MGKILSEIGPKEAEFITSQKVFFVATAPLDPNHTVSVSPKCNGCVVLDPHTVMYGDLTGSGSETAAHLLENKRMTLLFCNLEKGPPKILRLSGRAKVILANNVPKSLLEKLPDQIAKNDGFRAIYKLCVTRISTSCGYSLPIMEFVKHRTVLDDVLKKMGGPEAVFDYQTTNNSFSIDGLPSLALLRQGAPEVVPVEKDGYIIGKVVDAADSRNDENKSKEPQGTIQPLPKYRRPLIPSSLDLCVQNLVAMLMLSFAVGITAGVSIANKFS